MRKLLNVTPLAHLASATDATCSTTDAACSSDDARHAGRPTEDYLRGLMAMCDKDGDGRITEDEFGELLVVLRRTKEGQ